MTKGLTTIATKKRKISHSKLPPRKKDAKRVERPHADPEPDFSNATTFNHLHLSSALQKSISDMALFELSPLQRQVIPALLGGRDVVATTETGRDAILSFLVPAVTLLEKHRFHSRHGTGVLIVTSNRETAVQISGFASELLSGTAHTVGMVIEGANRGSEVQKLERGVNLLVATPARLLEHFQETTAFVFKNLKAFCVYGAEQFSDSRDLKGIISFLPKKSRISAVFGAENTDELEGLSELICRPDSVSRHTAELPSTNGAPKDPQGYVVVDADKRLLLLYSFLKKFQRKKIVVLMSSTPSAAFYSELLNALGLPVHTVHGRQNARAQTTAFSEFTKDEGGTLIITEEAAQGLVIPPMDWVLYHDPPRSIRRFIQQRGTIQGRPVAFVQPSESEFVDALRTVNVPVEEFDFPKKKLLNIQAQVEKLVAKNFELHTLAKDAFRAFLQDYNHHRDSKVFDVTKLDLRKAGKSFGFDTPPRVEVKTVEEKVADKFSRPYGPAKPKLGVKRKAQ